MPDPSRLRDSTQIVLPPEDLDGLREDLTNACTLTITTQDERCRIIGSPVEIKKASDMLSRRGVPVR